MPTASARRLRAPSLRPARLQNRAVACLGRHLIAARRHDQLVTRLAAISQTGPARLQRIAPSPGLPHRCPTPPATPNPRLKG